MSGRLRELAAEARELEARLRLGGGADKIERQHAQGKMTARERVSSLCDRDTRFLEIGLLVAYDRYDGQAPAAGQTLPPASDPCCVPARPLPVR